MYDSLGPRLSTTPSTLSPSHHGEGRQTVLASIHVSAEWRTFYSGTQNALGTSSLYSQYSRQERRKFWTFKCSWAISAFPVVCLWSLIGNRHLHRLLTWLISQASRSLRKRGHSMTAIRFLSATLIIPFTRKNRQESYVKAHPVLSKQTETGRKRFQVKTSE